MKRRARRAERGFTLLEVAVVIGILGSVVAVVMSMYNVVQHQKKARITRENMHIVASALSTYVESAGRLPCPSDPASPDSPSGSDPVLGWERGVGYDDTTIASALPVGSCDTPETSEGVVPFLTLGIPFEAALDGWGSYLTYAVSPVFAQQTDQSGGSATDSGGVHALCRSSRWVTNSDNANGPKAKFCCALSNPTFPPSEDIVMRLAPANTVLVNARDVLNYGAVNQQYLDPAGNMAPPPDLRDDIDTPAFVLISHGRNRSGAYVVNGTADRIPFDLGGSNNLFEKRNQDGDRTYYTGPRNEARGRNYFDDIVVWRTQDGLMAYNGTSSCSYP